MPDPASILAATDLSPSVDRALPWSARLARSLGARLHLAHAVAPAAPLPVAAGLVDEPAMRAAIEREKRAALEAEGRRYGAAAVHLVEGEPAVALAALAERLGAGAIVLGRHDGPEAYRIDHVAVRLVRAAAVPVWSVPPGAPTGDGEIRRLLCPTDLSRGADRALADAVRLAARFDAEVHLLHVLDLPGYVLAQPGLADELERRVELEVRALAVRHRDDGVRVDVSIGHGPAAEVIVRRADELGVDAIVVPTHARSRVGRFFLGSVAERLIRTAHRPVVSFRRGGAA